MYRNYLKIAVRNIWKNKAFSLINIIGLSIGLSAAFVIGIMIYYDLSFDKFHPDGERIYRITSDFSTPEGDFHNRGAAVPLGKYAAEKMTGLETATTFFTMHFSEVKKEDDEKVFRNIEDAILAEPAYFELFDYTWLAGSFTTLSEPGHVVLTKSRANRYFPNVSVAETIGKTLMYNGSIPVKVVGIVADITERTDFYFKEFVSLKTARNSDMEQQVFSEAWNNSNSDTQVFIKIGANTALEAVQKQFDAIAIEHADKEMYDLGQRRNFAMQPLADIHFNGDYGVFKNSKHLASRPVLTTLGFVALFLLLLGCINFINLNTAQATKRAKEIGVRKTLGSSKNQLVLQFLGETFLLTISATVLSIFMSSWLLRYFSDFIPQGVNFELFANPMILIFIVVLLGTITFLSGFYPALVLSRFKPISVLKNQVIQGDDKSVLRKYLTVFQFTIAQIFIIATVLVGKQIHFMTTKDMGFKTDAIAYIRTPWQSPEVEKRTFLMNKIKALPLVNMVSLSGNTPASFSTSSVNTTFLDGDREVHSDLQLLNGDQNYLDLYKIELLAGRKPLNDSISEYVINETFLKKLGFKNPEDAIDRSFKVYDVPNTIVGVMKDFNQRSLKSKIEPLAFVGQNTIRSTTIHFSLQTKETSSWPETIKQIEDEFKSIYPDYDFDIRFMDDTIKQFYEQERKTSVLLTWATGLAILISCLGLLGLVIHTTERRTKEIGIRKILGASLAQLNVLLYKEFLILVGIAFAIAAPIAWYGLNNWLQDFAYKTDLSWWVFVLSGLAMLLIALIIIGIRTIAAANVNPVKSLRTE